MEALKNIKNTPEEIESDIGVISSKMESEMPKIEKLAQIGIGIGGLKDKITSVSSGCKQQEELLDSLKSNIEKNKSVLENNLKSFDERLKKLGL